MKGKDQTEILLDAQAMAAASAPAADQKEIENSLINPNKKTELYFRVVKSKSEVYDIITRSFSRKKRWNELPHGLDLRNSWNLLWSWSKISSDISRCLVWQRVNHF